MAADRHNNTESDGRVVMEGGIPHRGSPLGSDQHRVIKIANLYTDGLVNRIPHILVSDY